MNNGVKVTVAGLACSMNLHWQMVLKVIARDYKGFLDNVGWDQWFAGTAQDSCWPLATGGTAAAILHPAPPDESIGADNLRAGF